jgi:hypothetical protein
LVITTRCEARRDTQVYDVITREGG